jgi:serine/threonine protein kinase
LKNLTPQEISQFSKKIKLNHQLKHKNIVCINNGWISQEKEELVIISEIITGGSLKKYLSKLRQPRLKVIKMWCRGVLSGLDYLHSQKVPIVHGDLTSDNIFIMSSDGTVKISDFYLNKLVNTSSMIIGSPEYMAPEIFLGHCDTKADIYSFGMSLLEMCTRVRPYDEYSSPMEIYNCIRSAVLPKSIGYIKDPDIVQIINLCLADQSLRPTAKELLSNKLLEIDENPKNCLPVSLTPFNVPKLISKNPDVLPLSLIIKKNNTKPKEISFCYNLSIDSPEKVAKEMVESLNLNKNLVIKIAEEIEKKLENYSTENIQPCIKIYKYNNVFEPNTATLPEIALPKLRSCLSVDSDLCSAVIKESTVKRVQTLLSKLFAAKINADGFMGKKTKMFLKKFQDQEGLIPNGIVTEELIKLLTHRISAS